VSLWSNLSDALIRIVTHTVDLIKDPSWKNAGYLVLDIGSAFVPFVPAAGTVKTAANRITGRRLFST